MDSEILDQALTGKEYTAVLKNRVYLIWGFVLLAGIVFHISDWPGNAILILFSSAGLFAYALNGFIRLKERNPLNTALSISGLAWLVFMIVGNLLYDGDAQPYNQLGLAVFLAVVAIAFTSYYFLINRKIKSASKP